MSAVYTQHNVDPNALDRQRVAVIGYGSQGRGQALNLRDSGVDVVVGVRPGGPTDAQARTEGWAPMSPPDAARDADVICMLVPDMAQPEIWEQIRGVVKEGALLMFSHGFNIHYKQIEPPATIDVAMVAPKGPGGLVRRQYEEGAGVPCLVAVHHDGSGTALARALAYAHHIGGARAGVLETTFAEETETDLFGEQAVLCGGVTELVVACWETLVDAGYQPETAYFECLHELKLIVDLIHEGGLARMHKFVSDTAKYGDLSRGPRVVNDAVKSEIRKILEEIRSGAFADEWINEHANGSTNYKRMLQADLEHPIEAVGREMRARMAWLPKDAG